MNIDDYVNEMRTDSTRWFPDTVTDVVTLTLGLVGESGEVADIVKKVIRGSATMEESIDHLHEELIDVFHYWCLLIGLLEVDVETTYKAKREVNIARYES